MLNGQAVSFIAQGKYPEAEAALSEALEKDPNNPETLVNLIVLSHLTGKQPEVGFVKFSEWKKSSIYFKEFWSTILCISAVGIHYWKNVN